MGQVVDAERMRRVVDVGGEVLSGLCLVEPLIALYKCMTKVSQRGTISC